MFSSERSTTRHTGAHTVTLGGCLAMLNAALHRTILQDARGGSSADEPLITVEAGSSSTSVADSGTSADAWKRPAAYLTSPMHGNDFEAELTGKRAMLTPELSISPRVARPAKRDKVLQYVGFLIGGERLKRDDVVNRATRVATMLASVIITRPGKCPLCFPVRASIFDSRHASII